MESRTSRKLPLTATIVKEQLSFLRIPLVNNSKIVKFAPNKEQKRYVIFDAHRDAPVGFGVAVNRTNMSPTALLEPPMIGLMEPLAGS